MFEVGFSELLLIMGLSLLVLGPEKLPKVVGEIGRWMGRARAMARQFREQLEEEAHDASRRASRIEVPDEGTPSAPVPAPPTPETSGSPPTTPPGPTP